jgi:predicted metalloendopeptidase
MPQRRLALRLAEEWLTGSLGDVYVRRYVAPLVKTRASSIAQEIRRVASEQAGSTEWLEPKTRSIASAKVKNIYLGIAYPSTIQKDEKTTLDPEQLVKNVLTLAELDFVNEMEKINTRLKPEVWDDSVFAVNAYYYNEGNRLILPAGILRWPFFDIAAGDGWNFGGLGATIGHEITHAFDNDGKDYDEFGNKKPWWSKAETVRYTEKANALIRLYNKTHYFGRHLNGHLTLSENIADLGGVAFALEALKRRLKARRASQAETKKEICDFFISFAVSWRTKEKKEKAMQSLFMDVHAPPHARVNNIVSQFDDWYEYFNIKPGDRLYRAPEDRIKIF